MLNIYSQAKNDLRQLSDSNSLKHLVRRDTGPKRKFRQSNNKKEKQNKRNSRNKTNKRKKSGYGKRTKPGGSRKMTGAEIETRFWKVIVMFLGGKRKLILQEGAESFYKHLIQYLDIFIAYFLFF